MNATEFWYCVIAIAAVSLFWLIVVLLVFNVRVTTSLAPAVRVIRRIAAVLQLLEAPDATTPLCPHCGAEAKPLGVTSNGRWFYCTRCNANPWREDARVPERRAVAS